MEGDKTAAKTRAQREAVWNRRVATVRRFAELMPGFTQVDPQTADALAEYLTIRRATLYRHFGQAPVRGAYVLACCQYLYAPWQALLIYQAHAADFPRLWHSRRRAIRGLAYVTLASITKQRQLFQHGLAAAQAGCMLRDVDLIAVLGRDQALAPHTTLDLDPEDVEPHSVSTIPVLEDLVTRFMSFLELPIRSAHEVSRKILEVGTQSSGSNVMGEANRVLAWASDFIDVEDEHPRDLQAIWLATQLIELRTKSDSTVALPHIVRLLNDSGTA